MRISYLKIKDLETKLLSFEITEQKVDVFNSFIVINSTFS